MLSVWFQSQAAKLISLLILSESHIWTVLWTSLQSICTAESGQESAAYKFTCQVPGAAQWWDSSHGSFSSGPDIAWSASHLRVQVAWMKPSLTYECLFDHIFSDIFQPSLSKYNITRKTLSTILNKSLLKNYKLKLTKWIIITDGYVLHMHDTQFRHWTSICLLCIFAIFATMWSESRLGK